MSSSRSPSPSDLEPLRRHSSDDVQETSFALPYDGRRSSFRTRPRRLLVLLFVAALAVIAVFSERYLLSEPSESPLYPSLSDTLQNVVPPSAIQPVEPVVITLIMYSEDSAREGAILLKSAIMYTSRPLEFHIVCDDGAIPYLENRFSLLTHPVHPITVRLYRISFQSMVDRLGREGSIRTGHPSGVPGLMKLFLHELLPDDVTKAIFVDTDAFFLTDPALLWEEFSRWGPNVAVSIPYHPNLVVEEWYNATAICSCIMLLHLEKLRSVRLMDSSIYRADQSGLYPPALAPPTFTALFGPPGPDGYENAALGDQSYWWAIVSNRRDIFEPLPHDWEVTSCQLDMYGTTLGPDDISEEDEKNSLYHAGPRQGTVIVPKLLHFNCVHDPVFFDSPDWSDPEWYLSKRWGPAVNYHVGFKWLWLNRGFTESPVDIQVTFDPIFADQRFALEHPEESDTAASGTPNTDT